MFFDPIGYYSTQSLSHSHAVVNQFLVCVPEEAQVGEMLSTNCDMHYMSKDKTSVHQSSMGRISTIV